MLTGAFLFLPRVCLRQKASSTRQQYYLSHCHRANIQVRILFSILFTLTTTTASQVAQTNNSNQNIATSGTIHSIKEINAKINTAIQPTPTVNSSQYVSTKIRISCMSTSRLRLMNNGNGRSAVPAKKRLPRIPGGKQNQKHEYQ